MEAEVVYFRTRRVSVDPSLSGDFESMFGLRELPLVREDIIFEIKGVPVAVPNAIRRAMMDEMKGHCLTIGKNGYDLERTTEKFVNDHYVRKRLEMIPLTPHIPKSQIADLRFAIHFENNGFSTETVHSGDLQVVKGNLRHPLFNPTFEIALVQPGKAIHVEDILISEGIGYKNAAYNIGVRGVCVPVGLEEYPRESVLAGSLATPDGKFAEKWSEMFLDSVRGRLSDWDGAEDFLGKVRRQRKALSREENPTDGLPEEMMLADWSGYRKSSLVMSHKHHRVSVILPATQRAESAGIVGKSIVIDACRNIKERLRYVQTLIEEPQESTTVNEEDTDTGSQIVVDVVNETHTIGNLVSMVMYSMFPEVEYVGYTHEYGKIQLTVRHSVNSGELRRIFASALMKCFSLFDDIEKKIREVKIERL